MQTYDVYALFGDVKESQAKILAMLQEHVNKSSKPTVYNLVQIQDILHVSKRTVASWLKSGVLPHSRLAGKIWVTENQLHSFLDKHANQSL
jgi:hypothetical protein